MEGHTDSTGSDEFNQKLSEQRAKTVRNYLIEQGLSEAGVAAQGFGKTMPIADNSTAAGRQLGRPPSDQSQLLLGDVARFADLAKSLTKGLHWARGRLDVSASRRLQSLMLIRNRT